MSAKKRLNIGMTVNLDNYENIRLETEGEVETEEDAVELVRFLDGLLGRMGRGDEQTAGRIDSYRRRVFASALEGEPAAPAPERTPVPAGVREPEPQPAPGAPATPAPEAAGTPAPEAAAPPAPEPETAPPGPTPAAGPERPAGQPQTAAEVCEECGGPVTAAQKKVSQMFLGRTLCKKCMPTM